MGDGAVLVLPDGGTRSDYLPRDFLREYAVRHGNDWYKWLNREKDVPNGSLYLITGLDKTQNWCLASYSNLTVPKFLEFFATDDSNGQQDSLLHSDAAIGAVDHQARQYAYSHPGTVAARTRQLAQDGGLANQSVFIRGFKLTINPAIFKTLLHHITVNESVLMNPTEIPQNNQDILGPPNLSQPIFSDGRHPRSGEEHIEVPFWYSDAPGFYPEEDLENTVHVESCPEINHVLLLVRIHLYY